MITFIEWIRTNEIMRIVVEQYLREATSDNSPATHFQNLATMVVRGMRATLTGEGTTPPVGVPQRVQQVAQHIENATQLEKSVLGRKMYNRLRTMSPSDQDDMVQQTLASYIVWIPKQIVKKYGAATPTPQGQNAEISQQEIDALGSYLSASFLWKLEKVQGSEWRRRSRPGAKKFGTPLTDIAADDGQSPEASYRTPEEDDVEKPKITNAIWEKAATAIEDAITEVEIEVEEIQRANAVPGLPKRQIRPTTQLENRIPKLKAALALLRALPAQMGQYISDAEGDNEAEDRIYVAIKRKVLDPQSRMEDEHREALADWAKARGGDKDAHLRELVAAAMWFGGGMKGERPTKLVGPKKQHVDWFLDYAMRANDNSL